MHKNKLASYIIFQQNIQGVKSCGQEKGLKMKSYEIKMGSYVYSYYS